MTFHGPAVPLGYDSGLVLSFAPLEDMTDEQIGQMLEGFEPKSPLSPSSAPSAWLAAKSPGGNSLQPSIANSSRSPGTGSLILTPTSTLHDNHGDVAPLIEDPESDDISTSPNSNISPTSDDFIYVGRFDGDPRDGRGMNNWSPPSGSGSGSEVAANSALLFRSASIALASGPESWSHSQSFASTITAEWMDQPHANRLNHLNVPAHYSLNDDATAGTGSFSPDLLAHIGHFDDFHDSTFAGSLPFRDVHEGSDVFTQGVFTHGSPFASQNPSTLTPVPQQRLAAEPWQIPHHIISYGMPLPSPDYTSQQAGETTSLLRHSGRITDHPPTTTHQGQDQRTPLMAGVPSPTQLSLSVAHHPRLSPYPQPPSTAARAGHQHGVENPLHTGGLMRPLQPAIARSSRQEMAPSLQNDRSRKGGRAKNSHLSRYTRDKTHKMRKAVACWRCALQRDTCPDENTPCQRCVDSASKGHFGYFTCNRSKLPDFVYDFLPPSMTLMHQKQTIEDTVNSQVSVWDVGKSVDVFFTSGYGPALRWTLYEFKPKTDELLWQYQYLQDPETGKCHRYQKYSPPLGLRKLDTSDDTHFDKYLNDLLDPHYLWEFGSICFEEETQVNDFQACLLELMCDLYIETQDVELHNLLASILRMMIVTYIMGHTLTLVQETLHGVLKTVQHSYTPTPNQTMTMTHTSPRLANRQLKFFFSILRTHMVETTLAWCQKTLHSSGKKESTWLPAFCVLLALAMTVEELQRTLHVQADAKASKGEMSVPAADVEALNACARMDADFGLVVGLFQCKYRDRKWSGDRGSFGNGTPEVREGASKGFLQRLRALVVEKREHLESRRDVPLAKDNQCLYTSRLVARFLLPFLDLPPT